MHAKTGVGAVLLLAVLGGTPLRAVGPVFLPPMPVFELSQDFKTPREKREFSPLPFIALSLDGSRVAFLNQRSNSGLALEVWSVQRRKLVFREDLGNARASSGLHILAFLPDGKEILVGTWHQNFVNKARPAKHRAPRMTVRRMAVPSGKMLATHVLPPGLGMRAVPLPDGKTLALSSRSEDAVLYDLIAWKQTASLKTYEKLAPRRTDPETGKRFPDKRTDSAKPASALAASPDGKLLAIGTEGGWVSVWDIPRHKRLWRKEIADFDKEAFASRKLTRIHFYPRSDALVTLNDSARIDFWLAKNGKKLASISWRGRHLAGILPDNDLVLDRASRPGFVRWDPVRDIVKGAKWDEYRAKLRGSRAESDVRIAMNSDSMALSTDGKTLAMLCYMNQTMRLSVFDLTKTKWPDRGPKALLYL